MSNINSIIAQRGTILIIAQLLLASLMIILVYSTTRSSQHVQLISNYQHHFESLKHTEQCFAEILSKLPNFPNPSTWEKSNKSKQGLYNREKFPPITLRKFTWHPSTSKALNVNCRYIIEYFGTTQLTRSSLIKSHVLRISIRFKQRATTGRILQILITISTKKENKNNTVMLKNPAKIQQWALLPK